MHSRNRFRRKEIDAVRIHPVGEQDAHVLSRLPFPLARAALGLLLPRRVAVMLRNLPPRARAHAAGSEASARAKLPRHRLARVRDSTKNPRRSCDLRARSTGFLASERQRNLRNSRTRDWRASASISETSV